MSRPHRNRRADGASRTSSPSTSPAVRAERVATDIHAVLARTLREEVKDPRVASVSITAVRLSKDLSIAHVNFVPLGGQGDPEMLLAGLRAAAGFLRRAVGQEVRLRHTPELQFHLDDGLDDSLRMTRMLRDLEEQRGAPLPGEGGGESDSESDSESDEGGEE